MESIPSIMLYSQALSMLSDLQTKYQNGVLHTVDDVATQLRAALNKYESAAGTPLTEYEPVRKFEPPSSDKMNRFWSNLAKDVSTLENQLNVLNASAVFTHNFIVTEIEKAKNDNSTVKNQLKSLQLYSSAPNPKIVTFSDNFHSYNFIDDSLLDPSTLAIVQNDQLTLGLSGSVNDLTGSATIVILPDSNGFAGNNQEIQDPSSASINALTGLPQYTFEGYPNSHADINVLVDGQPNTWFEYEHYTVSAQNRAAAQNFGFLYSTTDPTTGANIQVDWATAPDNNELALSLQITLSQPSQINFISYTPYGLDNNVNNPVVVREVIVSGDGTNWTIIPPGDVWIGTDVNLQQASITPNMTVGTAVWNFSSRSVQYIRMLIEQLNPIIAPVGHVYYVDKSTGARVSGPIPPEADPIQFYLTSNPPDTASQRIEYFMDERWAIGIKGIDIQQIQYQVSSSMVSVPFMVNGIVDRCSITADIAVPNEFDKSQSWVQFFVSPDNGNTWYPISPIQDDLLGIPEEIAFNDPTPSAFHEAGVAYYNVNSVVNMLRVKIVVLRPADQPSASPAVNSYTVKALLQ